MSAPKTHAPFSEDEMLDLAARAIGKIDARGSRGIERLTNDEIEAMALTLVCLGMKPIPYHQET
ncbi:hypothetical protein [Roseobacter sp. TSBP12]|uniref:hypothetical protein n=1 Tax=Roseobacter sp. TSBP12 TaxID=1236613 RepID=UPI00125EFB19|nr:hypothetical protein [Roseobacter sp. TSBP12]KAB6715836.1 hypothetical protein C8029_12940 [Roseobacter sp. TSBP12]